MYSILFFYPTFELKAESQFEGWPNLNEKKSDPDLLDYNPIRNIVITNFSKMAAPGQRAFAQKLSKYVYN